MTTVAIANSGDVRAGRLCRPSGAALPPRRQCPADLSLFKTQGTQGGPVLTPSIDSAGKNVKKTGPGRVAVGSETTGNPAWSSRSQSPRRIHRLHVQSSPLSAPVSRKQVNRHKALLKLVRTPDYKGFSAFRPHGSIHHRGAIDNPVRISFFRYLITPVVVDDVVTISQNALPDGGIAPAQRLRITAA